MDNPINGKTKILLVDDNLINIKVMSALLKEFGYDDICVAYNGQDTLKLFANNFDVILLDIGLPDISGLEICKMIRNQSQEKDIVIIAVTAHGEHIRQQCLDAGANGFLTKPVMIQELIALIKHWVNNE